MSGSNENDHVTEGFQGDVHACPRSSVARHDVVLWKGYNLLSVARKLQMKNAFAAVAKMCVAYINSNSASLFQKSAISLFGYYSTL